MTLLPQNGDGAPYLLLAPMEGVGDRPFRKAMASIGGFDEGVREFLRVPRNAHVESLAKVYNAQEIAPIPLAAQLMGSDPALMAAMAQEVQKRGAPRIDINCGCPSHTVTGRGAGSTLLKDPSFLEILLRSIVQAVSIPVTVKMRSGFDDTSLLQENLLAAQEAGVQYITLHPRTKQDGYTAPAQWELIAKAKELLRIPIVGNGDILTVEDALCMLQTTRCDALMIGRGAVVNPFLFHQIKAHFSATSYLPHWKQIETFFSLYLSELSAKTSMRMKINKVKQMMSFLFRGSCELLKLKESLLSAPASDVLSYLDFALSLYRKEWRGLDDQKEESSQ